MTASKMSDNMTLTDPYEEIHPHTIPSGYPLYAYSFIFKGVRSLPNRAPIKEDKTLSIGQCIDSGHSP